MRTVKKFLGLGVVVSINLVLQFLFQWYLIVYFGAGTQSDIFFGSTALPQFILLVLSGSLTMVLIPMISKFKGADFLKESWNYFQGIGLLFVVIAVMLCATAQWWVQWTLPGFEGENYELAVSLTRIQLLSMVFSAMLSVLWAVHSARENFYLIETTSIFANLVAFILFYFALEYLGIYAAAWVTVIKSFLQMLLLMRILGPYQRFNRNAGSFKVTWKKLRPLVVGNLYYKTDLLADKDLTSRGVSGELTLLNLAQQLYAAGNSILTKVFVNTMVPPLAKAYHDGNETKFNYIFRKRLVTCSFIALLVFILVLLLGKWALAIVFTFKNFGGDDVERLWWLLVLLSGFFAGGLLGAVTSSAFYSKGDTVTPTKIGAVIFTVYMPIKIFCYYSYGIKGLAISVTVYYLVSVLIQLYFLKRHLFKFN
jgi:peptidoglycan biosynthesis protein MviN/MurJ (putative lipid II flippase)